MHFHRGLSLAANAKGWGITKKVQMCYLLLGCCGLESTILFLLVCYPQALGPLFTFQCFSQLLGAFKICFVRMTTEKKWINYREKCIIQPDCRTKKNIQWAFPIRQGSLLMSGNVLNSYPRGGSDTMTHIHERSSVTRRSQLLPVTHNSWSKLKCQKNSCQTAASLFCHSYNYDEQPRVCA